MAVKRILFFPGATGEANFWLPVARQLPSQIRRYLLGYPGFGKALQDPLIRCMDDWVERQAALLQPGTAIVAQSMGCVLAVQLAARRPELISRLVLTGMSGGVDVQKLGGIAWQDDFEREYPHLPTWFSRYRTDLTPVLMSLRSGVLLLSGDSDPISPPTVGVKLASLIPRSRVVILPGAGHDMAVTHVAEVTAAISAHLFLAA